MARSLDRVTHDREIAIIQRIEEDEVAMIAVAELASDPSLTDYR